MKRGFTLVEIMIVVAIIALLAAIAIPNLLRARLTAQEAAAAAAMHTIATAEIQWRANNPAYTTLAGLGSTVPPYIDATLAGGLKQTWAFSVPLSTANQFFATGTNAQGHSFYIDDAGVLCRSTAIGATALAAHQGGVCPAAYPEMQ